MAEKPIFEEIATSRDGRDITRGYVDALPLLSPTDTVLAARGGDYRIYEEILRDDQVQAAFQQRRLAVVQAEWEVIPGGKRAIDREAADFIREQLLAIAFDDLTARMLFGVFFGYAVAEVLWARDGKNIVIDAIKVRHPRRFGFAPDGSLRLLTLARPDGEPVPPGKFWWFATGHFHDDDPYGLGLAHWLYWPVFFKRNGIKFWLIFLEKFGMPTVVGKYPPQTTEAEKQRLLEALAAVQTDSAIRLPEGMQVELLEAARSGTADYGELVARMDAAIAKVILGQTMTIDPGSSRAQAQVHLDVRQDIVKADADLVCESFNRHVINWLVKWNFPNALPPRVWRRIEEPQDSKALAETYRLIFDLGYRPTLGHIQEAFGGEWETQGAMPQAGQPPAAFAETIQKPHPVALMTERLAQDADTAIADIVGQILEIVNKAEDLEHLKEMILAAFPAVSTEKLTALLAEAIAAAEAAGRYDASHGQA